MEKHLYRLAFIVELIINGTFVVLYTALRWWKLPFGLTDEIVNNILSVGVYVAPFVLAFCCHRQLSDFR